MGTLQQFADVDEGFFAPADVAAIQPKPPRLEDLPMRALNPDADQPGWHRERQFRDWVKRYGHFGSVFRCHGWVLCQTSGNIHPDPDQWPDHELREFTRHLDCENPDHRRSYQDRKAGVERPCSDVGGTLAMVACACGWESAAWDVFTGRQGPILEGLDHLWPGWRSMPVLSRRWPSGEPEKTRTAWIQYAVDQGYELEWLEAGGPFLTERGEGLGDRHVPGSGPNRRSYEVACRDGVVVGPG